MDNYDKTRDAFYAVQTARLAYECDPTPANKRRWDAAVARWLALLDRRDLVEVRP